MTAPHPKPSEIRHPLSADRLQEIGRWLYDGHWRWRTMLAHDLRCSRMTVRAWCRGTNAVPGPATVALAYMVRDKLQRTGGEKC